MFIINFIYFVYNFVFFSFGVYTSATLGHYLLQKDTYLCGTARTNRKGYPAVHLPSGKAANRLQRGTIDWRACGDFVATMWKDNKPLFYLSTAHSPEEDGLTTKRRKKDGSQEILPNAPCVKDYGKYMGGVDRLDQNTRQNKGKKPMRWYRRVEVKLREIAIYNAYVIEGTFINHMPGGKRKRDMLAFKLGLLHQLIGGYRQDRRLGRSRSVIVGTGTLGWERSLASAVR
ncbi:piggyBac transposable element-derived protein 3-like [Haliotis rubra]|uniref:piggyBac transposable element-derived protein 3-like n=1 Tax=Haliotis rubra TaxID=36100 RepID=UPI001EE51415|nr:piggyBac transposable element-derived protein 3-like [Haliotis rubra]